MANVSATCVSKTTVRQAAPKSTKNREATYIPMPLVSHRGAQSGAQQRSPQSSSHTTFCRIGRVELCRDRAAIDLAGAVERQRRNDVDKARMRIGRSLA